MFKVEVKKNGVVTNGAHFKTLIEAQEWINKIEAKDGFGKRDRWVSDLTNEDVSKAIEFEDRDNSLGNVVRFYHFGQEYIVDVTDISAEYLDTLTKQASINRMDFGRKVISEIFLANKKNKEYGKIDKVKFKSLLADKDLAAIERCLLNGSLETAKEIILTLDDTYYTAPQKQLVVTMITDYLAKEG